MDLLNEVPTTLDPIERLAGVTTSAGCPVDDVETCREIVSVGPADVALQSAFRIFTDAVLAPYDVDRMLRLVTRQVVTVLGVDGAGVSLASGDGAQLQCVTATDDAITAVERRTSPVEGPCHEAYLTGEQVTVDDLELEGRWPSYRQIGLEHGVHGVAGIPMSVAGQRLGAFNLYRNRPHMWGDDELETAQLLADMTTGYLIQANRVDDERSRSEDNLKRALEGRDIIGQAKGILMSQHRLTADASFDLLRRTSQARNIKLRAVAAHVIETGALPDETG
jgi:GAF domain-containing protein